MPEESLREIAATNEPHHTLASPEFFFLLQRIDKLDETLTQEIKDSDQKLEGRIDKLENRIDKLESRIDKLDEKFSGKLTTLNYFAAGALFTLVTGFIGVIATLLRR